MGMKYKKKWLVLETKEIPTLCQGNLDLEDDYQVLLKAWKDAGSPAGQKPAGMLNPDVWCGRTSASMIYNYYMLVRNKTSEMIVNQRDKAPYDLVYQHEQNEAQRIAAAGFNLFDPLTRSKSGTWLDVKLFPKSARAKYPSPPTNEQIKAILDGAEAVDRNDESKKVKASIFDSLDRNNPMVFFSAISERKSIESSTHIIVISGYEERDDGHIWLQIDDPSTMIGKVDMLKGQGSQDNLSVEDGGSWTRKEYRGSKYWIKASRLFEPNEHTTDGESDLWCDNANPNRDGFNIYINVDGETPNSPFSYPKFGICFPLDDKNAVTKQTIQEYYDHTEREHDGGNFPLGTNTVWHGGVHLHTNVGSTVVACADGTVVAARLSDRYKDSDEYYYGHTNFVLVKHELTRDLLKNASYIDKKVMAYKVKETSEYVIKDKDVYLRSEPKDRIEHKTDLKLKKDEVVTIHNTSGELWEVSTETVKNKYVKKSGLIPEPPFYVKAVAGKGLFQHPDPAKKRFRALEQNEVVRVDEINPSGWWKVHTEKGAAGEQDGYVAKNVALVLPPEKFNRGKVKPATLDVYDKPVEHTPLDPPNDNYVRKAPLNQGEPITLAPPDSPDPKWRHIRTNLNETGYVPAASVKKKALVAYRTAAEDDKNKLRELKDGEKLTLVQPYKADEAKAKEGSWIQVKVRVGEKEEQGYVLYQSKYYDDVKEADKEQIDKMLDSLKEKPYYYSLYMHLNNEKLTEDDLNPKKNGKASQKTEWNTRLKKYNWLRADPIATVNVKDGTTLCEKAPQKVSNSTGKQLKKGDIVEVVPAGKAGWWEVRKGVTADGAATTTTTGNASGEAASGEASGEGGSQVKEYILASQSDLVPRPQFQATVKSAIKEKPWHLREKANHTSASKAKFVGGEEVTVEKIDPANATWWEVSTAERVVPAQDGIVARQTLEIQTAKPTPFNTKVVGGKLRDINDRNKVLPRELEKGEPVTVIEAPGSGWWKIRLDEHTEPSQTGFFSSQALEPVYPAAPFEAIVMRDKLDLYPETEEYRLSDKGEVAVLKSGDTVWVHSDGGEWWQVQRYENGQKTGKNWYVWHEHLTAPKIFDDNLMQSLQTGKVVKVEKPVKVGEPLWSSGVFGSRSPTRGLHPMIHWEIFSELNFFAKWKEFTDTDEDFNVNCKEILDIIKQQCFGEDPEALTSDEIRDFYSKHKEAVAHRKFVCKFTPEWGIDLNVAVPKLRERFRDTNLKKRIEPYLWWQQATDTQVDIPADKKVWHYNPVAFVEALSPAD